MLKSLKKFLLVIIGFLAFFSVEDFKRFLADDSGGLVLSFDGIEFPDSDWLEYKLLRVDKSVKSIDLKDLPEEFLR